MSALLTAEEAYEAGRKDFKLAMFIVTQLIQRGAVSETGKTDALVLVLSRIFRERVAKGELL